MGKTSLAKQASLPFAPAPTSVSAYHEAEQERKRQEWIAAGKPTRGVSP